MVDAIGTGLLGTGLLASLGAGAATGLGALPVLVSPDFGRKALDRMLGFSAGVMLAATAFSLVIPALGLLLQGGNAPGGAVLKVGLGMLLGALFVRSWHALMPHSHVPEDLPAHGGLSRSRVMLFVLAITLHNFPEGLAVGVSFAGPESRLGLAVALGIAVHNLIEGLVVAVALRGSGMSASRSAFLALLTGLVEPLGGLLGVGALSLSTRLLPWGLTFAGGAMLYVVTRDVIPESRRSGFQREATSSLMWGFALALALDLSLA
ncbi:ZIP family metal transporter [Archangium lansingense]|uniref:ZIP family metal transporter n=1 Tax=Archangium lansingense TaxID=2995310 RepID=A0ABT4A129_9BACT|nr:ZIP family metal transporter [Archangium lansinium]MCY1075344.1 ZIP family metal transporter [Archangium lansinium]